jgi:hypothetical protein
MAADPSKSGPQARSRINTSEDYEMRYWSRKLGVSPEQLKAAIRKVGSSVRAIERELKESTTAREGVTGAAAKVLKGAVRRVKETVSKVPLVGGLTGDRTPRPKAKKTKGAVRRVKETVSKVPVVGRLTGDRTPRPKAKKTKGAVRRVKEAVSKVPVAGSLTRDRTPRPKAKKTKGAAHKQHK